MHTISLARIFSYVGYRPGRTARRFAGLPHRQRRNRLLDLLLLWQGRATQRYHLAQLDDAMLKDIGLSRADADREAAKPFWRA